MSLGKGVLDPRYLDLLSFKLKLCIGAHD